MEDLNSTSGETKPKSKFTRLHLLGVIFTLIGFGLFAYLVWSVGVHSVIEGIGRIGVDGLIFILFLYFLRFCIRAICWKLCVNEPYKLSFLDTLQAVIIGEALSVMIPLGILISGTAKAIAVKRRVPLVVGFSSVATENLFYSLVTGLVIVLGGVFFLREFDLPEGAIVSIDTLIAVILLLTVLGFAMVIQRWHWISTLCEKLYEKGILVSFLKNGRLQVRRFENLIYDFYRDYPGRFVPIVLLQVVFHILGIVEAWFVLSRVSSVLPTVSTSFLLESISRGISVIFKLIPFSIGVDEAGAQFVSQTLALGVGVGLTLAIVRKVRGLFWTGVGLILLLTREFSLGEIFHHHHDAHHENNEAGANDSQVQKS